MFRHKIRYLFTDDIQIFTLLIHFIAYDCIVIYKPLLSNDSVNTYPRETTSATIGHPLLDNGSVNTPHSQQRM
jgi:hypothetical protein